jgi:uncharacterized protein (DUF1778 family)
MKQHRIYIRVTEHEKKILKERAEKTKKNLSEYILLMTLKREVVFTSNEMVLEILELKKELRAVTNQRNMNPQIRSALDPIRASIHSILKRFS